MKHRGAIPAQQQCADHRGMRGRISINNPSRPGRPRNGRAGRKLSNRIHPPAENSRFVGGKGKRAE